MSEKTVPGDDRLCIGDKIKCHVKNPSPATLCARLDTPEAVEFGSRLISNKESGWTKVDA